MIKAAFDEFMKKDFEGTCILSTKASWGGGCYYVELFDDGSYRVLSSSSIGNLYDSPGLIIGVPTLSDDDLTSYNIDESFFDNCIEEMREKFDEAWAINNQVQDVVAFPEDY